MPATRTTLFLLFLITVSGLQAQLSLLEKAQWARSVDKLPLALEYLDEAGKTASLIEVAPICFERGQVWEKIYWKESRSLATLHEALSAYRFALQYSHDDSLRKIYHKKIDLWWRYLVKNGQDAYSNGKYAHANKCFKECQELSPARPEAFLYAALCYFDLEEWEQARKMVFHALDRGYHHAEAYRVLIHVARHVENDTRKAVIYASEGLFRLPEDSYLRESMALMLLHLDEYVLARPHMLWMIRKHPEKTEYLFNLAMSYEKTDEIYTAEWFYESLLEVRPEHFDGWYNLGVLNYNQASRELNQSDLGEGYGHLTKAMYAFEEALQLKPGHQEVISNLLNIYGGLHLEERTQQLQDRIQLEWQKQAKLELKKK